MTSRDRESSCGQRFYDYYWGSGFLPSEFQGVKFRSRGNPVLYLGNPPGLSREVRQGLLDDPSRRNQLKQEAIGDPEVSARISQYEMAYRMQASVPALTDLSTEPQHVLDMYGPDVTRPGSYARNCLLARPLDETLVIWGGEFGRTVFAQGDTRKVQYGRDHHGGCFTIWMAGGGVQPGYVHGETDDFAYNITRDPVHVHDFQATLLHLLGIDHERLTFKFQGRHYRLTDVHGKVVQQILA